MDYSVPVRFLAPGLDNGVALISTTNVRPVTFISGLYPGETESCRRYGGSRLLRNCLPHRRSHCFNLRVGIPHTIIDFEVDRQRKVPY